ncbi:hypothetical protein QOZ83_16740, partial [Romboutsia sedimentorum]|uniref:hypothetical protein n=1 Tax=Romboutsia sedimentorum TaxID=1368474 RepID=UPI0024DE1436
EAIMKKLDNIKVKRVPRTNHLVKQALDVTKNMYDTNVEVFIEVLRKLDESLVGERFMYLVSGLDDEDIVYSDTFVEDMLKKEAIKFLKNEDKKIDKYK